LKQEQWHVAWDECTDKEMAMDYIYENPHMTRINPVILSCTNLGQETFFKMPANKQFNQDNKYYRQPWQDILQRCGRVHISTQDDAGSQKQIEAELRINEARLNEAQRLAKVGSWELDLRTNHLFWTNEIYNLFELDKECFTASYEAFLDAIHPDDRESVNQMYLHSLQSREPYTIIHRLLMADGRIKWVEERGDTDFADDGTPIVSRGTVQDITERKLAEEELEQYREHLEEMVQQRSEELVLRQKQLTEAQRIAGIGDYDFDLRNQKLSWGPNTFRLFGFDVDSFEPSVEIMMSRVHPDDIDYVVASQQEVYGNTFLVHKDGQIKVPSMEFRVIHPDGSTHWFVAEGVAELDDTGQPVRVRGTVQDISGRKHIERQNLQAREEAERANAAKSEFLSRMSHELRTPLNAILGFGQLLEIDDTLGGEQRDQVDEILNAGKHLLVLVDEVLDLSRIESGRLELKLIAISSAALIEACVRQIKPLASKRDIDITLDLATDGVVLADQTRFKQVLFNLLSNAAKYNYEQGRIDVTSELNRDHLRISVMDTGVGIASDHQGRLFQPFERVPRAYEAVEGTGIGLALAKKLVESMAGEIGFQSVEGRGSTFWFTLPLYQA
jgi:PAS domain S-box-containing protein